MNNYENDNHLLSSTGLQQAPMSSNVLRHVSQCPRKPHVPMPIYAEVYWAPPSSAELNRKLSILDCHIISSDEILDYM